MKIAFIIIISIHALIHLMGFAKAFRLAEIPQIKQPISSIEGALWAITAILLLAAITSFSFSDKWFLFLGTPAIVISQILIFRHWHDSRYGTIANVIMILPLIVAFARTLPSGFKNAYKAEAQKRLTPLQDIPLLTGKDIQHLPAPIQKYLYYTGSVGKPLVHNFRSVFEGGIRRKISDDFMKMHGEQCNFYDTPARVFYIESKMKGIPFDGLHLYANGHATMNIKIASLLPIADGKGAQMTKGETVTLFNDMCVIAPATLISKNIQWEPIDTLTVNAKFTNAGYTISATLFFNEKGALINFSSDDRYLSDDGKTFINYRWTTPLSDYKEFGGRKIATYGEAIWHTPEGEFCYGKFKTLNIEYNIRNVPD